MGLVHPQTTPDLYLGYRPSFVPYGPVSFSGLIDEVALYNRALSATEISRIYNAGAAGKCADVDHDGLPDWWEVEHFGNLEQSAGGDYDDDGVLNVDEYLRGSDPNTIEFLTSFSNDHVSSNSVSGTITVLKGVPAKMAVLVNTTNCPPAAWTNFMPLFSATLPREGTNEVRVGLRGLPAFAEQTWDVTVITRDTNAPSLIITNPALTVTVPMVQLQGYSTEPLSAVRYDITNSAGLVTNLEGHITHQDYSTNIHAFTTNYFQCFDIDLVEGQNLLTLRATDLAGNITVTNLAVTVQRDSVSPVINLIWPTNGMTLCGDSFMADGWLDDPTAIATLDILDEQGLSSSFTGAVERNGRFWFENLPLGAGSNQITLTATDAWGNFRQTNLVVFKSTLALTMYPIDPYQLSSQPLITVMGNVGDPTYTVRVNGVSASNNQGYWSAEVPVNPVATAIFTAVAYPPGQDGNPAYARPIRSAVDPPFRVYVERHELRINRCSFQHLDYFSNVDGHPGERIDWSETQSSEESGHDWMDATSSPGWWKRCQSGSGQYVAPSTNFCVGNITWPASDWPALNLGTWSWNQGECIEPRFPEFTPCVVMEQGDTCTVIDRVWGPVLVCDLNDPYYGKFVSGIEHREYTRSGHSAVKVFTGGNRNSKGQIVVELYAWASQILSPWAECVSAGSGDRLLSATETTVGDFGVPNDDYTLYGLAPVRATEDATLRAPVQRQSFSIEAVDGGVAVQCEATTPTNRSRTTVGVGEKVTLTMTNLQRAPPITWSNTAGSLSSWQAFRTTFTAPSNAAPSVKVTGYFPNRSKPNGLLAFPTAFTVVEPTGIDHAEIASTTQQPIAVGVPGAWMHLNVFLAPTNVSFYRVQVWEEGKDASSKTGYFTNHPAFSHIGHGANQWHPVAQNNLIDVTNFDFCWLYGSDYLPATWEPGGEFSWDIPAKWKVEGAATNSMTGWDQRFQLSGAGTLKITKFNRSVERTVNNTITPSL